MGRASRRKKERRALRTGFKLPPCSYQKCEAGRPPAQYVIRKTAADEFLSACVACVEPMMAVCRAEGVDAQVFSREALMQLNAAARKKVTDVYARPVVDRVARAVADRFAKYERMTDTPTVAGGGYAEDATRVQSPA